MIIAANVFIMTFFLVITTPPIFFETFKLSIFSINILIIVGSVTMIIGVIIRIIDYITKGRFIEEEEESQDHRIEFEREKEYGFSRNW